MTTAQVVERSVTVNNNSPIQDYVHPDDQTQPTFLILLVENFFHLNHHRTEPLLQLVLGQAAFTFCLPGVTSYLS